MARKAYEESNIAAIAAKIREKTGGSEGYKTLEMPAGIDKVYDKGVQDGKAQGGGGLKPSEGLEFKETYYHAMWTQRYGWTGFGSCTDTEIVVPCATPEGYPVVTVGSFGDGNTSWDKTVWVQGVSKIYLPDTVVEIITSGFMCGDILKYIKFGRYLNYIGPYQYTDNTNPPTEVVLDFSDFALSAPPTLADTSILTGVTKVKVPSAMESAFKTAPNWVTVADKIDVVGESGGGSGGNEGEAITQTWTLNNVLDISITASWNIPFTSAGNVAGGPDFVKMEIINGTLYYVEANGSTVACYSNDWGGWGPPGYNIITFTTALPDDLAAWLAANGTRTA